MSDSIWDVIRSYEQQAKSLREYGALHPAVAEDAELNAQKLELAARRMRHSARVHAATTGGLRLVPALPEPQEPL